MTSNPYTIRWGILATGGIAQTFTKDLLIDPATRNATDIRHSVVAAASSTSSDRAAQFLKDCGVSSTAKAYGSYKELVIDPDIDIIYIATPHSHHYQNARLCLEAGKNVLCEKAFTTNAAQAKILVQIAKEKGLFLMEAVWTRYFPLVRELQAKVQEGTIGDVKRVFADLSYRKDVEKEFGSEHRMVNMDLAGGVLLDLGIYSLTWVFQFLYHLQPLSQRQAPIVASSITKYEKTGCDEMTSIILTFPATNTHGIATSNIRQVSHDPDSNGTAGAPIRIQGTLGEIQVTGFSFRPTTYTLIPASSASQGSPAKFKQETITHEIPGHGMFWEADECARCLRDGKQESEGLGWEESIAIMETMDEVRRQGGVRYPEKIESTEYPLEGF
ncbi:NAD(P)-binding protein [Mytilinidion resinicola]|uniref:D-xylose 1-dehydrogenase (NADP(+), D-xylono-1,5-lactone-forming) n=1 Tax=Mytilinidion resinicola TaxID=574789 RepID=A0A6A6YS04_9PEZI|nr:NAD(P)-binding protein [Mytilinidion resinicola]KAF2811726.1 NAD(P)-binding protein [Mytilinidion resinicola]